MIVYLVQTYLVYDILSLNIHGGFALRRLNRDLQSALDQPYENIVSVNLLVSKDLYACCFAVLDIRKILLQRHLQLALNLQQNRVYRLSGLIATHILG